MTVILTLAAFTAFLIMVLKGKFKYAFITMVSLPILGVFLDVTLITLAST